MTSVLANLFTIITQGIAEFITVSPDGARYAVGVHRRVDIYSIETAGIEYSIDIKVRIKCGGKVIS